MVKKANLAMEGEIDWQLALSKNCAQTERSLTLLIPDLLLPALLPKLEAIAPKSRVIALSEAGEPLSPIDEQETVLLHWAVLREPLRRLLRAIPNLRWLHSSSAGINQILCPEIIDTNLLFTNSAGIFAVPIAEAAMALILSVAKRLREFSARQAEHRWDRLPISEIRGRTIGIVGLGGIGREIARLAHAFGMRVVATRRRASASRNPINVDLLLPPERLSNLLHESDFVVITTALTEETQHLINAQAFENMRPSAWLVNMARGAIIDEPALVQTLQEKRIAGAALDGFECEPLPAESPLWELPNVIIMPHNSWNTPRVEERVSQLFLENLRRYMNGEPLLNIVDKKAGY